MYILSLLKLISPKMWATLAVITTLSLLYFYIGSLKEDIRVRDNTILNLRLETKTLEAERGALQVALVEQNSAIDILAVKGKKLQKELDDALARQHTVNVQHAIDLERIRNEIIPTQCDAAINWFGLKVRRFETRYNNGITQ